jgi:hypothetical protein
MTAADLVRAHCDRLGIERGGAEYHRLYNLARKVLTGAATSRPTTDALWATYDSLRT